MENDYNNTRYYLKKRGEMCITISCDKCPLSKNNNKASLVCDAYERNYPVDAIAAVKEWYEKEEKKFTYKDDFFSKFPDALTGISGHPLVKACNIYPEIKNIGEGTCIFKDCGDCWNMEMEER